jgi:hypothetical protein
MRADVAVSSLNNITSAPVLEEFPYFVSYSLFHICLHQEIYIVTCLARRSKTNKLTCEMIGFVRIGDGQKRRTMIEMAEK